MKKIILFVVGIVACLSLIAQTDQGITHQAVIRNNVGELVTNSTIGVKVSILQGSSTGIDVYSEIHLPVSNAHGLITYIIGHGTIVSGIFGEIDWSDGPYFLKTEVDPTGGTDYSISGVTQFHSVPYALFSDLSYKARTLEDGEHVGEISYWNGIEWLTITPGISGQILTFCNGIPTWGPCPGLPSVVTNNVTNISIYSATVGGTAYMGQEGSIIERGVYWGIKPNPETSGVKLEMSSGEGVFNSQLKDLEPDILYYVRAYAKSEAGTSFGEQRIFMTKNELVYDKVSGFVQKGPYINGTSITMYKLDAWHLYQTGESYTTQINNNKGLFEINNVTLNSNFVEFSANGYYYNEVSGNITASMLNLFTISDITDHSSLNINILTHLEKQRVEYLFSQGMSFSMAKNQAQQEVLAIFGIASSEIEISEALDISVYSEGNAILLAISVIVQGNRSVGELTELLANIISDFRENGVLDNQDILQSLRDSTVDLDLVQIRNNIESRYHSLGVFANIPNFEKYITMFLAYTGQAPTALAAAASNISTTEVTLNGLVNPNSLSTEVTFEYGTTEEYGHSIAAVQSPFIGSVDTPVYISISGLAIGTTYHFRVKSENDLGVSYGENMTFTTLGNSPDIYARKATNLYKNSAVLNATINPNNLETTVYFEYGLDHEYKSEVIALQSPVTGEKNFVVVNAQIDGLDPQKIYFYRAVAENLLGKVYGDEMSFRSKGVIHGNGVTDIDGNFYPSVIIGDQEWMTANLRTSRYNDGSVITTGLNNEQWGSASEGAYAVYPHENIDGINTQESMVESYGKLYNFLAVKDPRGLCPAGWRIPISDNDIYEFNQLTNYLTTEYGLHNSYSSNNINGVGNALKSCNQINSPLGGECDGIEHPRWDLHNTHFGTDDFGFNGIPGGMRVGNGEFSGFGIYGYWRASSEYSYGLYNNSGSLGGYSSVGGGSVRCIKNAD